MTIPRTELCGLVLTSRLALSVAKALAGDEAMQPVAAILLSDSTCCISRLEKSTSAPNPYFHNRVSEIRNNMRELNLICPTEELHHVAGVINVADLATRDGVKLSEIGSSSEWQTGPKFLLVPRDQWTVHRDFVIINKEEFPTLSVPRGGSKSPDDIKLQIMLHFA